MEVIQLFMVFGIIGGLIMSYRGYLSIVKLLLFGQAICMQLSNFNIYRVGMNQNESNGFTNY